MNTASEKKREKVNTSHQDLFAIQILQGDCFLDMLGLKWMIVIDTCKQDGVFLVQETDDHDVNNKLADNRENETLTAHISGNVKSRQTV